MKGSHKSRSTHSLGFVFILWCFSECISIKIAYFHLRYYKLFPYSKSSHSLITSKMLHITVPVFMKRFFTTSDIPTNIFLINAGYFCTTLDMLTINKPELFIKVQLKLVKLTSRMLPYIRQMLNISSLTDDRRLFMNTAVLWPHTYLPMHYITVTQFQYILTISIAWKFATN